MFSFLENNKYPSSKWYRYYKLLRIVELVIIGFKIVVT